MDKEFWKKKKLSDFSEKEWEAVCLRCGKCCLLKEVKNNIIFFSNHICNNFDLKTGKCSCYKQRVGPFCAKVDLQLLQTQRELCRRLVLTGFYLRERSFLTTIL